MNLVPYIVLVPEQTASDLDRITSDAFGRMPGAVRQGLEDLCENNGWSHAMLIAGRVLSAALEEQA